MTDSLREVFGCNPFGGAAAADQPLDLRRVVSGQQVLGPQRQLVTQQGGQQRVALIAPGQRRSSQRGRMWRADQRDGAHQPRMQQRGAPAGQPAVGVTDQRRRRVPERADQPGGVPGQCPAVITPRRLVAAAVAAQVHRDHPGTSQPAQLVTPGPPERAETVQQHDQWSCRGGRTHVLAGHGLDDMESDAIRVHVQMTPWPCRCGLPTDPVRAFTSPWDRREPCRPNCRRGRRAWGSWSCRGPE